MRRALARGRPATPDEQHGEGWASPPIKVVRIIARLNVGGPARHCLLLGQGLVDQGFETLLLAGDVDVGEAPLAGLHGSTGFRVEPVPGLGRPLSAWGDLRALAHLVTVLRREQPDIVHTHTAKAGALGRVAARLAGVPHVVHTFHGHVLSGYFGPAGSALVTCAERALARLTERLITLSPTLRDELASRHRIAPREAFEVIPLGRDLAPIAAGKPGRLRAELGVDRAAVLVGCVGRLAPIKRAPLLVRAFAPLAARDPRARLVIVGDGPERPRVEETARALDLTRRVHVLGWRQDLPELYADLDLLAFASRNEGTPLAAIEAFAAGVPVVAPAVGGLVDMFGHQGGARDVPGAPPPPGVSLRAEGALVPPEDGIALAEALAFLAGRPDLRRAAGAAARQASARWSAARLVQDTAALYRRLLAGSA